MEAHGELDAACRSEDLRVKSFLSAILLACLFLPYAAPSIAQEPNKRTAVDTAAQKLYDGKQWEELVQLTNDTAVRIPELSFLRGMALMRLERYQEAREAFSAGYREAPNDERFLVERAGAEYRLKDFAAAKSDLRRALRSKPKEDYTLEFLGTIYLLEGNVDAALKYWNRIGKPRLASVRLEPEPRLSATLRRSTVSFNAPQVLGRSTWLAADEKLGNLGVFPQRRLELTPTGEQDYTAVLHLSERGWRDNVGWAGLVSLLSGVPYQTVYPEWYNIRDRAINFTSMARWDDQKRRAFASLSFPVEGRADRVASFYVDGRNENWNLTKTFTGSSSPLTDLNLRSIEAGADLRFVLNGDWSWNAGTSVVGRTFLHAGTETNTTAAAFFTSSTTLKSWLGVTHTLIRVPERRFTVEGKADSQFGRGYKRELGPFGSLSGSLRADWLPHASGEQDSVTIGARTATIFGTVPLDQLFELGLDRDSPLWLRGHGATTDGRKGAAPLGRHFVLVNSEYDRILYDGGFFRLQAGPLLDMGRITDSSGVIGDRRWLIDTGVQVKVRVLGAVSVVLSYGRDLRNGRAAFFGTTEH
jgi:tetratricopeptide repeat protein